MQKSFSHPASMFFLTVLTFMMVMTQTTVKANSSVPAHVSGYANHENNQNNWGLFVIIGVIAVTGLTKRNVIPKSE